MSSGRAKGELGQVAGIEGLAFGVLVFVLGSLVIANAWAVIDAKWVAAAAAREAVRTFVESPDEGVAYVEAEAAALTTVSSHGRDPGRATLDLHGAQLRRCAEVTGTVTYRGSLAAVPLLGRISEGFTVRGSYREVVDPYRSGLPGVAEC